MLEETEVLKLVCKTLDESNIPYMLTGSFAANFYATPRMTRDIDLVIEIVTFARYYYAFEKGASGSTGKRRTPCSAVHSTTESF